MTNNKSADVSCVNSVRVKIRFYQIIECQVSCPPHPRVQQPEDEGAEVVVAGEEDVDDEVKTGRRLIHGDGGDYLEDGPGCHHDDEGQGDG